MTLIRNNGMKKALCIYLITVTLGINVFALNENVVVWEQIYQQADKDEQRIAVILKIMELKDREFAPVLIQALDDVVGKRIESGSTNERFNKNRLAVLLVQELGNLKSAEASDLIFSLYEEVKEPILKGEAAIALGKIRASGYAERLAYDLSSLNLRADPSIIRNQEIISLALVQSLNSMRSALGYEAVFLASLGWYSPSSRVKETAKAALITMIDDPTDSLLSIMSGNPSIDTKSAALDAAMTNKASSERKAEVASRALQIGLERANVDKTSEAASAKLRITAISALTALQDRSPENVEIYKLIIKNDKKNDASFEETIKAYVALGVNGSDPAAAFLKEKLAQYNEAERSKANTPRDKSVIRQIIASMVLTKNPIVKSELTKSQFIDYDSQIIREIEAAIKTFP